MAGALVISLDFELHWGIRDHTSLDACRDRLKRTRDVIPTLLSMFQEFDVAATWATVGFLFARSKSELLAHAPEDRPTYRDALLSPYPLLDEIGNDEREDPFHYAPSLIEQIANTPKQRVGTHTFSHFYCCEEGVTPRQFEQDIRAAHELAGERGIELESIVFPRNQWTPTATSQLPGLGIKGFRPNPDHWAFRPRASGDESPLRRLYRLADAYVPMRHSAVSWPAHSGQRPTPVCASRFLRPYSKRLRHLERFRLDQIQREMAHAAREGHVYHLWWHPHNFGSNSAQNLESLRAILEGFRTLREQTAMDSLSMETCVQRMSSGHYTVSESQ